MRPLCLFVYCPRPLHTMCILVARVTGMRRVLSEFLFILFLGQMGASIWSLPSKLVMSAYRLLDMLHALLNSRYICTITIRTLMSGPALGDLLILLALCLG
jgi:hypothetical protein